MDLNFFAVIPAAGTGSRMQCDTPKAYLPLDSAPLIDHSITAFQAHAEIAKIVIAVNPTHQHFTAQLAQRFPDAVLCEGGETRQQSVYAALRVIAEQHKPPSHVLIHDAARPYLSQTLLQNMISACKAHPEHAIIPVTPPRDTIKQLQNGKIVTLARANIMATQTPQAFPFAKIYQLHQEYRKKEATDDASLFEWAGLNIHTLLGETDNEKITYPRDLPHRNEKNR